MAQNAMQGIMGLDNSMPMMPTMAPQTPPSVPAPSAEQMSAFDRMRQQMSPTDFANEMLRAGEEIDPAAVQQLRQQLSTMQLPPELLGAMLNMVEMILAEPQRYAEIRQQLIAEGVPEDILPAEFDGEYFGALQIALEQMAAIPAAPMNFANGGIASLKPIAQELQQYGRRGDTMLAHITPSEARLLQKMGGSGTINPVTGLPEFFLGNVVKAIGNAFKSVGKAVTKVVKGAVNAVKTFVKSPVGKVIATAALAYFAGPAAASLIGVTSAAGVAAVSGFVGGAGASLLAGEGVGQALKSGATGALIGGATAGLAGGADAFASGSYTGPTTVSGQWNRLTDGVKSAFGAATPTAQAFPVTPPADTMMTPLGGETSSIAAPDLPSMSGGQGLRIPTSPAPSGLGLRMPTVADTTSQFNLGVEGPDLAPPSTMTVSDTDFVSQAAPTTDQGSTTNIWDKIKSTVSDILPGGNKTGPTPQQIALEEVAKLPAGTSESIKAAVFENALKKATPGILSTYGPTIAGGLGIMALTGGFNPTETKPAGIVSGQPTGQDLLAKEPQTYGVTMGPVQTTYNAPSTTSSTYTPYQDYYTAMANNPYMPKTRRLAKGGPTNPEDFPRRNGQISGPGTEKSDSIPAMLSDGEFVFTAKAVRGAGNGSRRAGAKRMYQMMKQLERNA